MTSPIQNRIGAIDLLRGFSLLGILIMNIQTFAMPIAAYFNPLVYGELTGGDSSIWWITRIFFDVKFLSIFSMLFGASLVLAGGGQARRRLGWLLIFGLLHGYLIFVGDILFSYAVVGLLILPARNWSVTQQVRTALALLAVAPLTLLGLGLGYEWLPDSWRLELLRSVTALDVANDLAIFRSPYLEQLPHRAELTFSNHIFGTLLESGWQAAGCMFLGMAAVRSGFFEATHRSLRLTGLLWGAGLALTSAGALWMWHENFAPRIWLFGQALHMAGAGGIAWGWVSFIVALSRRYPTHPLLQSVQRLGQVAFSAYILQSLIGLLVFSGLGLGQFGSWSRTELFFAPFLIWGAQLLMARAWTSRYRVGPLEALWRGLYRGDFSLGKIQAQLR
jgi:uncharacterized protein